MGVDSEWTFQEDPGAWHFIGISQGDVFLTVGAWLSLKLQELSFPELWVSLWRGLSLHS